MTGLALASFQFLSFTVSHLFTWSSCLLKLLNISCLLTWKTGLPSLKMAWNITPSEYMSEAESQLTERMYSGARYSGLGRQSGGRLGSHSLHVYLGYGRREREKKHKVNANSYLKGVSFPWKVWLRKIKKNINTLQHQRGLWRRCWSQSPWSSRLRFC